MYCHTLLTCTALHCSHVLPYIADMYCPTLHRILPYSAPYTALYCTKFGPTLHPVRPYTAHYSALYCTLQVPTLYATRPYTAPYTAHMHCPTLHLYITYKMY